MRIVAFLGRLKAGLQFRIGSKLALLIGLVLISGMPLLADTVLMRDGSRVSGQIVSQDRTSILIRSEGRVRRIQKAQIRRLLYGSDEPKAPVAKKETKAGPNDVKGAKESPRTTPDPNGGKKPTPAGPSGGSETMVLRLRLGVLGGQFHSDFEDRSRYQNEFFNNVLSAGSSFTVAPDWSDNSASGAQLGAELSFRRFLLAAEIVTGSQESPVGVASFTSNGNLASPGAATIDRSERTLTLGYVYGLPFGLSLTPRVGWRELVLEEELGLFKVFDGSAAQQLGINGFSGRGLTKGPVYELSVSLHFIGRWLATLGAQRYFLRGARTIDSVNVLNTTTIPAGTNTLTASLSPTSAQYRHNGSRVYAELSYRFYEDLRVYGSHLQENAKARYSQFVQPTFSVASSGAPSGSFNPYVFFGSEHRERFAVTVIGIEKAISFGR